MSDEIEWVLVDSGGWDLMVGARRLMRVCWRPDAADYATEKGHRLGRTWTEAKKSAEALVHAMMRIEDRGDARTATGDLSSGKG
jgi:hypothetical protein